MLTPKIRILLVPVSFGNRNFVPVTLFAKEQVHKEVPADVRGGIHYVRPALAYNRKTGDPHVLFYRSVARTFYRRTSVKMVASFLESTIIPHERARPHLITYPVPPLRLIRSFIILL